MATKGGFGSGSGTGTDELRSELELSFDRLQTDRIDLYYVHRLHSEVPISETMELLAEYVNAGRIEHVGLSDVTVDQIEEARQTLPIAAVQNQYSLSERKHDEVVDHCANEGIAFVPFFPLRTGRQRRRRGGRPKHRRHPEPGDHRLAAEPLTGDAADPGHPLPGTRKGEPGSAGPGAVGGGPRAPGQRPLRRGRTGRSCPERAAVPASEGHDRTGPAPTRAKRALAERD